MGVVGLCGRKEANEEHARIDGAILDATRSTSVERNLGQGRGQEYCTGQRSLRLAAPHTVHAVRLSE
jgi:hypothetical protein